MVFGAAEMDGLEFTPTTSGFEQRASLMPSLPSDPRIPRQGPAFDNQTRMFMDHTISQDASHGRRLLNFARWKSSRSLRSRVQAFFGQRSRRLSRLSRRKEQIQNVEESAAPEESGAGGVGSAGTLTEEQVSEFKEAFSLFVSSREQPVRAV